jgi:abortive infection protein
MSWINKYAQSSFSVKILMSLVIFLIFLIISSIIIVAITALCENYMSYVELLRLNLSVQSLGLFVIPPFFVSLLFSNHPFKYLQISCTPSFMSILGVVVCMVVAIPFMNYIIDWNEAMHLPKALAGVESWMRESEKAAQAITDQILDMQSVGELLIVLLIVGVLAGVGEELTFRGILQRLILDKCRNRHIAIWTAAFIFSAIHFQFYGFIPRLLLGAFFGYLLIGSGNLWLPIIAHFLNNAMTTLYTYFSKDNLFLTSYETIGTADSSTVWMAWVSLALFVFCCWGFRKYLFLRY